MSCWIMQTCSDVRRKKWLMGTFFNRNNCPSGSTEAKIHRCSCPLWKMTRLLHETFLQPPHMLNPLWGTHSRSTQQAQSERALCRTWGTMLGRVRSIQVQDPSMDEGAEKSMLLSTDPDPMEERQEGACRKCPKPPESASCSLPCSGVALGWAGVSIQPGWWGSPDGSPRDGSPRACSGADRSNRCDCRLKNP